MYNLYYAVGDGPFQLAQDNIQTLNEADAIAIPISQAHKGDVDFAIFEAGSDAEQDFKALDMGLHES